MERKLATVLFADLVASTELVAGQDPEITRRRVTSFFDGVSRCIETHGGTVEKFAGDAVMAAFGIPLAHEDDAERAIRAGFGILEHTRELSLEARVGIEAGEVVVDETDSTFATGEAVNVAARLQQAAAPGEILVGEAAHRLTDGRIEADQVGPLELRGFRNPIPAYRAVCTLDAAVHPRRVSAPFIGRESELDLLQNTYARTVRDRRPHVFTVYGEPGVGKSRLIREFLAGTEGATILSGRALPYGEGVTYWPLGEILKAHAGILDTDPPELAIEKIRKVGDELITADVSTDPARASAALAYTIALEDPDASLAGSDPREVRHNLHAAWRSFFSALARSGPVLVIVEDIHWADPALLDLLEDAADRSEGPLLFLCPARPELTARRPEWGGGRWNHSSLLLEPLSATDSSRLLDLLVEGGAVSSDLRTLILERAGGNPFFLEEIVQRLLDEPAGVEDLDIPDTVQGVLAARIDLLTPVEKLVLESASVVGRTFWNGAVASLMEPAPDPLELDDVLWRLEDRGLVHGRIGSTIVGEREFAFRHVLIKDVAYESLPRRDRGKAHARVAGWIEAQTKDREREFAELLAHHYEHAYQAIASETRPDPAEVERLREPAFRFALMAANEAGSKLALEQAERFAETALSVAAGAIERAQALEILGMAYFHDYRGDQAWQRLKEAIDLLAEEPEDPADPDGARSRNLARLCAAALEIVRRAPGTMRHRISSEEEERYLEIGLAAAGPGDSEERAGLLIARTFGPTGASQDELERAIGTGEEAAAMAQRLGRVDLQSAALDGITSTHHSVGRYGGMEGPIRRRLELAPKLSDPYEVGDIHAMAAWWALNTGRYRESLELADRGFTGAMPGSPVQALYCVDFRAAARFRLGDWDGVLADVEVAEELMGERRETPPGFAAMHLAIAAFVHDAQGDRDAARRYLQRLRWLEHAEERLDTVVILWQARLLARRGEYSAARALLERPDAVEDRRGQDEILEAWCEVVSEEGSWAEAAELAERAAQHAERAGEPPLAVYAMRLDGRAAAALGRAERAAELLGSAADAFTGLEAVWEAAATRLDLARVLVDLGHDDRATAIARDTVPVFERIRSVRELSAALDLIDRSV